MKERSDCGNLPLSGMQEIATACTKPRNDLQKKVITQDKKDETYFINNHNISNYGKLQ